MKLLIVSTQKSLYHAMETGAAYKTHQMTKVTWHIIHLLDQQKKFKNLYGVIHTEAEKIKKCSSQNNKIVDRKRSDYNINEQQYKENTVNVKGLLNEIMNLNYTSKFIQNRF